MSKAQAPISWGDEIKPDSVWSWPHLGYNPSKGSCELYAGDPVTRRVTAHSTRHARISCQGEPLPRLRGRVQPKGHVPELGRHQDPCRMAQGQFGADRADATDSQGAGSSGSTKCLDCSCRTAPSVDRPGPCSTR